MQMKMQGLLSEVKDEMKAEKEKVIKEYLKQLIIEKENAEIYLQNCLTKLNKLLDSSPIEEAYEIAKHHVDGKINRIRG